MTVNTTDQQLLKRLRRLHDDLVENFPDAKSDHLLLYETIGRVKKLQEIEQSKSVPDEEIPTRLRALVDDVADNLRAAASRIEELEAAADSHTCYLNE